MVKLKPGDRISCHLREGIVISPYLSDYDDTKTFGIIATDTLGYYLFVPPYTYIKDSEVVNSNLIKKLNLNKKYLGDCILYIVESFVYKIIQQMDGCTCCKCEEFFYMAEPSQEDGFFICHLCSQNPYR